MKKNLKLIVLGLCMLLGSACTAGLVDDYKELREDEVASALNSSITIQQALWAIAHYTKGLAIPNEERVSQGYAQHNIPYTNEELEGFIKIEKEILAGAGLDKH